MFDYERCLLFKTDMEAAETAKMKQDNHETYENSTVPVKAFSKLI
jgi:hypothetical protein